MKAKRTLFALWLISSTLIADDLFIQANFGAYDGKATSSQNTADDTTKLPSLLLGKKYKNMSLYLSYEQIKWEDAKAKDLIFNMDYIIPNGSFEYYVGVGIGAMKYESDYTVDTDKKTIATLKAGVNYSIFSNYYLSGGLRYLYTNDIEIRDSNTLYSSVDNLLGLEVGLGFRF